MSRRRRRVSRQHQMSEAKIRRIIRDQIKTEEYNKIFLNEALFGGLGLTALATYILKKVAQSPATRDLILEWAANPSNTEKLERFYQKHPVLGLGVRWMLKHLTVKQISDQLKNKKNPKAVVKTSPKEAEEEAAHVTGIWKRAPDRLQSEIESAEEDLAAAEPAGGYSPEMQPVPSIPDVADDETSFFSKPPPQQKGRRATPPVDDDVTDVMAKPRIGTRGFNRKAAERAVELGLVDSVEEFYRRQNLRESRSSRGYLREARDLIKLIRR